jgi:hypothetical protein
MLGFIMKIHSQTCMRRIALTLAFNLAAGCAALAEEEFTGHIDKAAVRNIEVTLAEDNLDQFGPALPKASMAAQIAKNLAEWNYPIQLPGKEGFSHTLEAQLGRITHQSTPTGFSFNMGNSDPRAEEFQKADVLTIRCSLTSNKNAREQVISATEFSANPIMRLAGKPEVREPLVQSLIDHISSACYNLLDDLELDQSTSPDAPAAAESSVKKPRWMPAIRIEVQNEPAPAPDKTGKSNAEKPKTTEEPRKKMIIQNQGTPVILKFGSERM